ncbi:MAG: 50S ribosomal protein L15 [Bdellovibrionaceae bacterium]|nr:50S ribosomal protein L15 [Pseudobdellovibrionaceae bacterium]
MSALGSLKKFKGSTHNTKALGRGRGSGKGGTSTKGGKGQKARKGTPIRRGFEGGQTPLIRRMPKVGFTNTEFKNVFEIVNLNQLQAFSGTVGPEELAKAGLVSKKARVKILGRGDAPNGLTVRAHKFSETAKTALEKAGGKVEVV